MLHTIMNEEWSSLGLKLRKALEKVIGKFNMDFNTSVWIVKKSKKRKSCFVYSLVIHKRIKRKLFCGNWLFNPDIGEKQIIKSAVKYAKKAFENTRRELNKEAKK